MRLAIPLLHTSRYSEHVVSIRVIGSVLLATRSILPLPGTCFRLWTDLGLVYINNILNWQKGEAHCWTL